jgi:hypothetical protein
MMRTSGLTTNATVLTRSCAGDWGLEGSLYELALKPTHNQLRVSAAHSCSGSGALHHTAACAVSCLLPLLSFVSAGAFFQSSCNDWESGALWAAAAEYVVAGKRGGATESQQRV